MAAILIAEDEPRIAAFVEKGLRAAGLSTTVARTGADALDYACTGEFDLMVLDIGLPMMDGFAVLEALRGQGSTLPVIILTARDSVTDTVAGLEGGADDYMAKLRTSESEVVLPRGTRAVQRGTPRGRAHERGP